MPSPKPTHSLPPHQAKFPVPWSLLSLSPGSWKVAGSARPSEKLPAVETHSGWNLVLQALSAMWPLALSIAIEWGDSSALSPRVSLRSTSHQCPQPALEPLSTQVCSRSVYPDDCPPHAPAAQNPYSSAQPGGRQGLKGKSTPTSSYYSRDLGPPPLVDKAE